MNFSGTGWAKGWKLSCRARVPAPSLEGWPGISQAQWVMEGGRSCYEGFAVVLGEPQEMWHRSGSEWIYPSQGMTFSCCFTNKAEPTAYLQPEEECQVVPVRLWSYLLLGNNSLPDQVTYSPPPPHSLFLPSLPLLPHFLLPLHSLPLPHTFLFLSSSFCFNNGWIQAWFTLSIQNFSGP